MNLAPTTLHQIDGRTLGIEWNDGHRSRYEVRDLRLSCRCALCVEEFTGEKKLDPATVPADIRPIEITPVGHYAIHIIWSDGHQSGIYAFEHLRDVCGCEECSGKKD